MTAEPIAVIGMGCRFPQAEDPDAYWALLRDGRHGIVEVPPSRWDIDALYSPDRRTPGKMCTRWGGFLDDIDSFDPLFFKIMPREAMRIDPQHRLVLEVAWEALEYAGVDPTQLAGTSTGVYIGVSHCDHDRLLYQDHTRIDGYYGPNTYHCFAANRLSFFLKLRGPSLAVDTACSSSLTAVHLACQSLRAEECDLALAGGVNLNLTPEEFIALSFLGVLSKTSRCAPFAADADGYVRGEGCGLLVLKRLVDAQQDGDNILAVIRGSALNHNGLSNGITAPNSDGQDDVIRRALRQSGVLAKEVSHIEAMSTGTTLGDPIEMMALRSVYEEDRPPNHPCWVSSVKANLGHLESASGAASLIKVILSLQHGQLPPQLHSHPLNEFLRLEETQFVLPQTCEPWAGNHGLRRAAVSAFGFGGSNAHLILEEAPVHELRESNPAPPRFVFTLSAKSEAALTLLVRRYADALRNKELPIADLCYTTNTGRAHWPQRLAIVTGSSVELLRQLERFLQDGLSDGIYFGRVGKSAPDTAFPSAEITRPDMNNVASWSQWLSSAAEHYIAGASMDWSAIIGPAARRKIPLPTYPFQRIPCRFRVEEAAGQ